LASRYEVARVVESAPFAWVEITKRRNKVAEGRWALGHSLWSPVAAPKNGADVYAFMRQPTPGDLVIHFVEEGAPLGGRVFAGTSRVAAAAHEMQEIPPRATGGWAQARAFYVIELKDYQALDHPFSIPDFIQRHSTEITAADPGEGSNYPFATRRDGVRPQLQYLTKAPPELLRLLASALIEDDALAEGSKQTNLELWIGRDDRAGLAKILTEKFNAHVRSTAYMARLRRWFANFRSVLGPGDPIALVLGPGGYTGRIGSVKANHGRLIWMVRDSEVTDTQARRAIIDAFTDRPSLRTVLCVRPRADALGSVEIADWGMRGGDPLIERLREEGALFRPIEPYLATATTVDENATIEEGPDDEGPDDEGTLEDVDWSEVKLEQVMDAARIEGVAEPVLRALAALASGMNVIFVGPPGTGKSSLAAAIFQAAGVRFDVRCASDQWTTYDTIGGYFPEPDKSGQSALVFRPGALLGSIQLGRCVIIDEINRADIDKAFGELFTLFGSKEAAEIQLPVKMRGDDGELHDVILAKAGVRSALPAETVAHRIEAPSSWRMIGTMNDADRASLKRLSLAFARRFAMIPVRVPAPELYRDLLHRHLDDEAERLGGVAPASLDRLSELVNGMFVDSTGLAALQTPLGPGFAMTVLDQALAELVRAPDRSVERAFLSALELYVAPQFQGLATKHPEFVGLVRRLSRSSDSEFDEFQEALVAWTGGGVAF
jgi:hypothetical protein